MKRYFSDPDMMQDYHNCTPASEIFVLNSDYEAVVKERDEWLRAAEATRNRELEMLAVLEDSGLREAKLVELIRILFQEMKWGGMATAHHEVRLAAILSGNVGPADSV